MPVTLSPSGTYGPGTVTAPVDGEPRSAGSVATGLQQLLDMVGYVKTLLDSGVLRIRSVASVTALKALTGHTTGDHATVKDLGLYQFDASSALTANDVTVVQPTVGGGRWLHVNRSSNVSNGFASLDSAGKVPNAQLRGVLSQSQTATPSPTSGNLASQIQVIYPSVINLTLAVGDVWMICGRALLQFGGSGLSLSDDCQAYIDVVQPDTSTVEVSGTRTTCPRAFSTLSKFVGMSGLFKAIQAGTHTLRFVLHYSTAPSNVTYSISTSPTFEAHRLSVP